MVKLRSVSDSKSGIQFGFELYLDPNSDLNETILDLHSSGLQTRNTQIDTQGEKKKTDRKDRDIRTNTDEPTHGEHRQRVNESGNISNACTT